MYKNHDIIHSFAFMYTAFAHLTDGEVADSEKKVIGTKVWEWLCTFDKDVTGDGNTAVGAEAIAVNSDGTPELLAEAHRKQDNRNHYMNCPPSGNEPGGATPILPPRLQRQGPGDGGSDTGEDGPGRHLRPDRRRIRALLHRRLLAGPSFRENAL